MVVPNIKITLMSKDLPKSHLPRYFFSSKTLYFIVGILIFNVYLSDSLLFSIFLVSLLSSLHGLIFFLIVLCDLRRILSLFLFCAHWSTLSFSGCPESNNTCIQRILLFNYIREQPCIHPSSQFGSLAHWHIQLLPSNKN